MLSKLVPTQLTIYKISKFASEIFGFVAGAMIIESLFQKSMIPFYGGLFSLAIALLFAWDMKWRSKKYNL